jgi:hypothetical protein
MRKQISYLLSSSFLGLLALLMWACYPSSPSNVTDTDLVFTFYNSQFNFGTIRTYALPNTVFDLEGSTEVTHEYDALILSEVDTKLSNLGYIKELTPEQNGADVVVVVSVSKQTRVYADFAWYSYWGSWPGWAYWGPWDSGWGIDYPWARTSIFSAGSIFIEIVDPKAKNSPNKKLPARWAGVINGLLVSGGTVTSTQIANDIDQCFAQSPYLGK